jgi:hypothetical protein
LLGAAEEAALLEGDDFAGDDESAGADDEIA